MEAFAVLVLLTQVLVTLVHASGMENLAENWIKQLKKESQGMDMVRKVEELEMVSKVEVEKMVETSGVLVIFAPQNSLGCILHSQLARLCLASLEITTIKILEIKSHVR